MKILQKTLPKNQRKYVIVIALCTIVIIVSTYFSVATDQTIEHIMGKCADIMQQVKSLHMTMNSALATSDSSTSHRPDIPIATYEIDSLPPDQVEMHITLHSNPPKTSTVIQQNGKNYTQDENGKWSVSRKDNSLTDTQAMAYLNLSSAIDAGSFLDHGDEISGNHKLRHVTVILANDTVPNFLADAYQEKIPKNLTIQSTTLDFWIDESTYYLNRIKYIIIGNASVAGNNANSSQVSKLSVQITTVIDYSKFNEPITITVPQNISTTK